MNTRKPEFPVDAHFPDRWSPRSFTEKSISRFQMNQAFEAAKWSPSASNSQPWRFVYALRGTETWEKFVGYMVDANQVWAKNAAALVVVLSKTDFKGRDKVAPSPTHSFDTGAAWLAMTHQLNQMGFVTHGMAGIHKDKIRHSLTLPENIHIEAMVAIGEQGPASALPEPLSTREVPSQRRPVEDFAAEGHFPGRFADHRN